MRTGSLSPRRARAWFVGVGLGVVAATSAHAEYLRRDLVSDQAGQGEQLDANLVNAWGIGVGPTGPAWVSSNGAGVSTLYDGSGAPQPLVVTIPGFGSAGTPTGIVRNTGADFAIQGASPAAFMWATESGTIAAWNGSLGTQASTQVDLGAAGAVYKGLALDGSTLFAANFHNATIDAFGGTFTQLALPGGFTDPVLPAGYAPFNATMIGASLFVSYAVQDATGHDDVPGAAHGLIDEFDTSGNLVRRFTTGGVLNSPWGMALAPADFGPFSNALLVGNHGDGRINAFDLTTGSFLGTLDEGGVPIEIDGLFGLSFGNGAFDQPTSALFFAAGPGAGAHGLYGRIDVPAPADAMVIVGALIAGARRRRSA